MKVVFQIGFLFYATLTFSQQNSEKAYRKLYISEKKYSLLFPENWYLKKTDSLQNSFILLSEKVRYKIIL
jgi:hypothetical protein